MCQMCANHVPEVSIPFEKQGPAFMPGLFPISQSYGLNSLAGSELVNLPRVES